MDSKHIVLDFEILKHLALPNVITDIRNHLEAFVEKLQTAKETGRQFFYFCCCS